MHPETLMQRSCAVMPGAYCDTSGVQKMADIMKKVAGTSLGTKSSEQTAELAKQNNRIGEVCK